MTKRTEIYKRLFNALVVMSLLIVAFIAHRIFTFPLLSQETTPSVGRVADSLFVGFLSDLWIAFLGSAICLVLTLCCFKERQVRVVTSIFLLVGLSLLCLHQSYVEFFGIQILPFHFRYFLDKEFIVANGTPDLSFGFIAQVLLALIILVSYVRLSFRASKRYVFAYLGLVALAVGAHILNIRWKVDHFIQEYHQTNVYERLVLQLAKQTALPPLDDELLNAALVGRKAPHNKLSASDVVFWRSSDVPMSDDAQEIKKSFKKRLKSKKHPLVIVVLLESARASDFSVYATEEQRNSLALTPHFDELAAKGLLFSQAYSTGTVTRSGQEAVMCGTLSSMYSSLMRERSDLHWKCLPTLLSEQAESFWFHGGDAAFDGQYTFWRQQGVTQLLARQDFNDASKGAGWGISDLQLFRESIPYMQSLRRSGGKSAAFGTILSITNHIPWHLPEDLPLDFAKLNALHPSAKTVHYVDAAIGAFAEELKKAQLWDDSLIIFVGDHGSKVPPSYPIYVEDRFQRARLMSHIAMLMSGGIVEQAKLSSRVNAEISSQAEIAPFIDWLFDDKAEFFAPPLLNKASDFPIFAQLEDSFFFPAHDLLIKRSDLKSSAAVWSVSPASKASYAYLVSFLTYMQQPSTVQQASEK